MVFAGFCLAILLGAVFATAAGCYAGIRLFNACHLRLICQVVSQFLAINRRCYYRLYLRYYSWLYIVKNWLWMSNYSICVLINWLIYIICRCFFTNRRSICRYNNCIVKCRGVIFSNNGLIIIGLYGCAFYGAIRNLFWKFICRLLLLLFYRVFSNQLSVPVPWLLYHIPKPKNTTATAAARAPPKPGNFVILFSAGNFFLSCSNHAQHPDVRSCQTPP
jgi:hypothetical protein